MISLEKHYSSPATIEDASSLIQLLLHNVGHNSETISRSIRYWDQHGCHVFAQAAKSSYYYDHNNIAGQTLRSLSNAAIIREQVLASKS